MSLIRAVILVGQLGKIWSKSPHARKVFMSMSAIGYYHLMETMYGSGIQTFTIGDQIAYVNTSKHHVEFTVKKITYKPIL